jgi:hypothetical protein
MKRQTTLTLLAAVFLLGLTACSNGIGDKSKVMKAINEGLAKSPSCRKLPIEVAEHESHFKTAQLPIAALLESGDIQEGEVFEKSLWDGKMKAKKGYVFTEKGKALIAVPADPNMRSWPCVAVGHWEVESIEALDQGSDATGKTIVNARARIRFVPRQWLEMRRNDPAWSQAWTEVGKQASHQWMYQLLKSGDSYFYQGKGKAID